MNDFSDGLRHFYEALPDHFPFYHLGEVRKELTQDPFEIAHALESSVAIAYRLQGDIRGLFVILFRPSLDPSTYSELGNIIASRTVTRLHAEKGWDIILSPPRILSSAEIRRSRLAELPFVHRSYTHDYADYQVPVETLILPFITEENAHA